MLSSRRVDALAKMARLTVELETIKRASGEMSDVTVMKLVGMLVDKAVEVAQDVAPGEMAAAFEKHLRTQIEATSWTMGGG
jgi:Asp-tRNA(Asn)/Glu-tRNA(Gln) amidotransferase C subunit